MPPPGASAAPDDRPPSEGPRFGLGARAILVLLSLGAGVVLGELGLRLYFESRGLGRGDVQEMLRRSQAAGLDEARGQYSLYGLVRPSRYPDMVYELKPGLEGMFRGRPVRTNAHGMRGPERSLEKPPGTVRIAGVGDSHMFGWGVGEGETYMELLEARLAAIADGRRYEVLNFGVPGYNTTMEAATFEHRVLPFDPDALVIHFVGNDFELPHFLRPPASDGTSRWYLAELVRGLTAKGDEELPGLLPHDIRHLPDETQEATRDQYEHMRGRRGLEHAMERIAELAGERGIPVVLMMLGSGDERRQMVWRLGERLGFRVVNAAVRFRDHLLAEGKTTERPVWRAAFFLPNDGHPTPLAHRLYAEVLHHELAGTGVVPAPARDGGAASGAP